MVTFLVFVDPGPGSAEWIIAQTGVGTQVSADVKQYMANIVDHDALHRRYAYCHENPVRGWMIHQDTVLSVCIVFVLLGLLVYLATHPNLVDITNLAVCLGLLLGILVLMVLSVSWKDIFCRPYVNAGRGWDKKEIDWYFSDEFTQLCKVEKMRLYRHTHPYLLNKPLFSIVGIGDSGMKVEYFLCSSPRS